MKLSKSIRTVIIILVIHFSLFTLHSSFFTIQAQNVEIEDKYKPQDDELLAAQYFQEKAFDKAAVLYEKLYNKNQSPFYYNNYLNCLFELKDFNAAEKVIKKRIKKEPSALKYRVDLGYMYTRAGQEPKAEKEFNDAIKDLTGDNNQTTELANGFLLRDKPDYAIKTYFRTREIQINNNIFNFELADIYEQKGDYQSMTDEYLNYTENNSTMLTGVENKLQIILSNDPDSKKSDMLKKNLLKRIQQRPDNTVYPELMLWLSIQHKDFKSALQQAKTLDRLFKENGDRIYNLARLCTSNKEYELAAEAYEYIINKGNITPFYASSNIELLEVKYLKLVSSFKYTKEEIADLESKYIAAINQYGKSPMTVNLIRTLAHIQAFYLNKYAEATDLLNEALKIQQISREDKAQCKMELGDVLLMSGDVWEATLLYSQVEKEFKYDTIGFTAKFKNAKLFYYIGEFKWAKGQLDILKAATSKLIANDAMDLCLLITDNTAEDDSTNASLKMYARADLYTFQNKTDLALNVLDSVLKLYPGNSITDRTLYKESEIKIKKGLYDEADTLLNMIVTSYSDGILADDALFKLAEMNQFHYNNKEKAMQLYEKLLKDYPTSLFVNDARKRFRQLRGDQVN